MASGAKRETTASAADSGIDHDQVDGVLGKPMPGSTQHIGSGPDIALSDLMRDIHEDSGRSSAQEDTFHLGDIGIGSAEIGEECDYTWGTWGTWGT
jgi:hypothetical protein